jgi:hypothetical protein
VLIVVVPYPSWGLGIRVYTEASRRGGLYIGKLYRVSYLVDYPVFRVSWVGYLVAYPAGAGG